jgi:galactose mutarotase-like enzyme
MPDHNPVTLTEPDGSVAVVAPELGGWLLRYARPMGRHGLVEALHFSQAVVDRYPRQMWAGNPILFPLVSNNRVGDHEHHYEWNGRTFEMPQHGFARRSKWTVLNRSANAVTLELRDSETTRTDYPFAFRHCLSYRLVQGRLHWEQVVENRAGEPMPFATGFHPYLRIPLTDQGRRDACFVEIPAAKRATPFENWARYTLRPFPAQNWSVQEDVAGTMFLTDLKKAEVILIDPISELELGLNFADAPQHRFLAIWSPSTEQPFYCLEPWTAFPNAFSRLKDHELIVLEPNQTFRAALWLELRPMV